MAQQICDLAKVSAKMPADRIHGDELDRLHKALGGVRVLAPSASAVVPIGEALLIEGLKRRFPRAEFYGSTTRPPKVYRGEPVRGRGGARGTWRRFLVADEPADISTCFANRVPLQYQPKACAISESVYATKWRNYELQQPQGSLPIAPLAVVVHLSRACGSPSRSEAKEAVAHYDELLEEMKLALQECGRKLGSYLRASKHAKREEQRRSLFEKYIPEVARALADILVVPVEKTEKPFYAALPAFVRMGLEEAHAKDDRGPTGSPSVAPPPPDSDGPPACTERPPPAPRRPARPARPASKKRGAQLTLVE